MAIFSANQRLDSSAGISLMLIIAFHIFILAAEPHFQQSGPLSIKHMKVQTFAGNQIAHLGSSTPSTPSSPHPNLFFQGHPPVSLWQSLKVVFWEKEHDFFPITWRGWGMPLIIHSFFDRTNIYSVPPPFHPQAMPSSRHWRWSSGGDDQQRLY